MGMEFIGIIRSWMLSEEGGGMLEYGGIGGGSAIEPEQNHSLRRIPTFIYVH